MFRTGFKVSLGLVLLSVLIYYQKPSWCAWMLWVPLVVTGHWEPCFSKNPITADLVLRASSKLLPREKSNATAVIELGLADYSFDALRIASQNWREPVVVRGMFPTGLTDPILSALEGFSVSVIQNSTMGKDHFVSCGGHPGVDSKMESFTEAISDIKAYDPASNRPAKTIVIPPASRSDRKFDPALDAALVAAVDKYIDLGKHIGGPWLAGVAYSTITQLFIGAGDSRASQGTSWHADICNNYFVQLEGEKEWIFVRPSDSIHMRPSMRRGKTAIAAADFSARVVEPYLNRVHVTLRPGDFLYNPDWYWHRITNSPGFAVGLVARECKIATRSFLFNPIFTFLIIFNHFQAAFLGNDSYAKVRLLAALGFGRSTMSH